MKAIYRNKKTGDIFAIETNEQGVVLSTCGPLLFKELDPKILDYDDYWNMEIAVKLGEFEKISVGPSTSSRAGTVLPTHTPPAFGHLPLAGEELFERLTRDEYRELLIKNGFVIQSSQKYLF